jgi:hypothetical protein
MNKINSSERLYKPFKNEITLFRELVDQQHQQNNYIEHYCDDDFQIKRFNKNKKI